MSAALSRNSFVVATKNHVSCDLSGETAVLDLGSGQYYGLGGIGSRVWSLVQEPKRVAAVLETLLQEYDVEPARCEQDLLALLERLVAKGLAEIVDEPAR
jgi:hypothetical protein